MWCGLGSNVQDGPLDPTSLPERWRPCILAIQPLPSTGTLELWGYEVDTQSVRAPRRLPESAG